jgi:hypothetical protein
MEKPSISVHPKIQSILNFIHQVFEQAKEKST